MTTSRLSAANRAPILVPAVVTIIAALALTLFAWPQARSGPRDLDLGVAGPPRAVSALGEGIAHADEEFDVSRYPGAAAARTAIEDREVYGALVASRGGTTLLTAPAASPVVAQLLEQTFRASPAPPQTGGPPRATEGPSVVEVVSGSPDDPRGAAFSASILPLILIGVVTGALVWRLGGGARRSIALLLGAGAAGGAAATAIVQGWLGVIEGGILLNAGVLALIVLAIAATVTGLARLFGTAGIGVAVLLFVLIGNPWSGVSSAPEVLPEPLGAIGQLLPPGAGGELLRGVAFFDGAGTAGALAVLFVWAVLGIGAVTVAGRGALVRAPAGRSQIAAPKGPLHRDVADL
jgi:hypothetical protein